MFSFDLVEKYREMEFEIVKSFINPLNNFGIKIKKDPTDEEKEAMKKCEELSLKMAVFGHKSLHSN